MNTVEKSSLKNFIGIDLHSTQFTCHFLTMGKDYQERKFPVSQEGIGNFLNMVPKDSSAMVEASTGTFAFYKIINEHENLKKVIVGNPHKLKWISMDKRKTDKVDSEKLAIILKMQELSDTVMIKPVYVPEEEIQQLRSLFTTEKMLTKIIVQVKNQIHLC